MKMPKQIVVAILSVIFLLIGGAAIMELWGIGQNDTVYLEERSLDKDGKATFAMPLTADANTHRFYIALHHTSAGGFTYTADIRLTTPDGQTHHTTLANTQVHHDEGDAAGTLHRQVFILPASDGKHTVTVSIKTREGAVDIDRVDLRITAGASS